MAKHVFNGHFQDGTGRAVSSGSITVYLAGTTTLATIYPQRDSGEASATADSDSVVSSSSSGQFSFYVDDADYMPGQKFKITLSKTGYTTSTYHDVEII